MNTFSPVYNKPPKVKKRESVRGKGWGAEQLKCERWSESKKKERKEEKKAKQKKREVKNKVEMKRREGDNGMEKRGSKGKGE